jgi:hypothetical protein
MRALVGIQAFGNQDPSTNNGKAKKHNPQEHHWQRSHILNLSAERG